MCRRPKICSQLQIWSHGDRLGQLPLEGVRAAGRLIRTRRDERLPTTAIGPWGRMYNGAAMDLLAAHAARQPDHPAIVDGDTVLSWHDFVERRNRSPINRERRPLAAIAVADTPRSAENRRRTLLPLLLPKRLAPRRSRPARAPDWPAPAPGRGTRCRPPSQGHGFPAARDEPLQRQSRDTAPSWARPTSSP
jgi:hypothetical protein